MEFFYFRTGASASSRSTRAGYFDLTAHDLGSKLRKQTVLRLEAMGIPVEYSFHENGPSQHEIDLRYTDALDDGRQRDDVPAHRQRGRGRPRRLRHVHAEADQRRVRFGDAHPRVAVRRRRQRVPRSRRRVRHVEGREALHRRPARARERDRRDHQPVGQLVQAVDPRLRSAGLQVLGAQQPFGARARAAVEEGQERVDAHRVPRARSRRATRTSRSR